jgi:hypothetical protein
VNSVRLCVVLLGLATARDKLGSVPRVLVLLIELSSCQKGIGAANLIAVFSRIKEPLNSEF